MSNTKPTDNSPNNSRRNVIKNLAAVGAGIAATAASSSVLASGQGQSQTIRPLSGKVAIVTGARNNMGRAFAVALASLGANVVIHYHRKSTLDQAQETARLAQAHGVKTTLVDGDLGQSSVVKKLYDSAEQAFGGIDIVVNNAGAIIKKPMAEFTDEEFESLDAINNRGLFYSLREASKRIRDGGRILNNATSLLAGAAPGYAIYAGTKAPVEEYTRMLAKELGGRKITVNSFAPGPIDTPFFHSQENEFSTAYATNLSTEKRLGTVDDIAPIVAFLAQPESAWINGQTLWVNGGYLTR